MIELWARAIRKNRIARSVTVPFDGDLTEALGEIATQLDISRPMFLGKHEREWAQFGQTSFSKDHFVDPIAYDKIEIELIDPDAKKKKDDGVRV